MIALLLHEAESAHGGFTMAYAAKDREAADRLIAKARRLWDEAHEIDPLHNDIAWSETRLKSRP